MIKIELVVPKPRTTNAKRLEFIDKWLVTLLVFGACGLAGFLVDFDHFTKIISDRLPITWQTLSGRTFHIPYFLLYSIIWLSSLPYVYRLFLLVLEDKHEKEEI